MAGAYCKFCGFRCFVYRIVPDGPMSGWGGHMATCAKGMEFDRSVLGHNSATSVNPVTDPEAAEAVRPAEGICSVCAEHVTLLGNLWTADDGTSCCSSLSAPYVPHKPVKAGSAVVLANDSEGGLTHG